MTIGKETLHYKGTRSEFPWESEIVNIALHSVHAPNVSLLLSFCKISLCNKQFYYVIANATGGGQQSRIYTE